MAIRAAVRWRPEIYRSSTEALIINAGGGGVDEEGNPMPPNLGQRVERLQLVVFNDETIGQGQGKVAYRPGHADTERNIKVCREVTISVEVSEFTAEMTPEEAQAVWDARRDAQIAEWQADGEIQRYVKAGIGAHLSEYVVVT